MNNFDLRKFLVENKLTSNSTFLQEKDITQPIPDDIVWTDEDEDTASHGTFNQYGQSAEDLDGYQVEVLGYSPSTGKAYVGSTHGSYGETYFEDVDGIRQMNSSETKNYLEALKKYEPEHFKNLSKLNIKEEVKLVDRVDMDSLEIGDVDTSDYPKFTDAYIEAATFQDGTPLTDQELDQLTDELYQDGRISDLAYQSLLEGKTKEEQKLIKEVLKTLK